MTDILLTVENIMDEIELEIEGSGYVPETYKGAYEVIPDFNDQRLETAELLMSDDVIVREIPVAEVSNPAGGLTLTIGK